MGRAFTESGLDGYVTPFIEDMAGAYAGADLIVGRSGAGAIAEIAAAGRPAVLVPFPFAADDHQRHNAEALAAAGAAVVIEGSADGSDVLRAIGHWRRTPSAGGMAAVRGPLARQARRNGPRMCWRTAPRSPPCGRERRT